MRPNRTEEGEREPGISPLLHFGPDRSQQGYSTQQLGRAEYQYEVNGVSGASEVLHKARVLGQVHESALISIPADTSPVATQ